MLILDKLLLSKAVMPERHSPHAEESDVQKKKCRPQNSSYYNDT